MLRVALTIQTLVALTKDVKSPAYATEMRGFVIPAHPFLYNLLCPVAFLSESYQLGLASTMGPDPLLHCLSLHLFPPFSVS